MDISIFFMAWYTVKFFFSFSFRHIWVMGPVIRANLADFTEATCISANMEWLSKISVPSVCKTNAASSKSQV